MRRDRHRYLPATSSRRPDGRLEVRANIEHAATASTTQASATGSSRRLTSVVRVRYVERSRVVAEESVAAGSALAGDGELKAGEGLPGRLAALSRSPVRGNNGDVDPGRVAVVIAAALSSITAGGGVAAAASAAEACRAAQLQPSLALQGATGHLVGPLYLRNNGYACTLSGRPRVTLRRATGGRLRERQYSAPPRWRLVGHRRPRGWPIVRLARSGRAAVWLYVSNWCYGDAETVRFEVALPGGAVVGALAEIRLRCDMPGAPVTVGVGPFERR